MITYVIIFVKNSNQNLKYRVLSIEYIVSSKERKRKERSKIILYSIELRKIKVDFRRRFFGLLSKYHKVPDNFSIRYDRRTINRRINPNIEKNVVDELKMEKDLIKSKDILII